MIYAYHPVWFFVFSFLGTWIAFFFVAVFSYYPGIQNAQFLLFFMGMLAPLVTALIMIYLSKSQTLIRDFWDRFLIHKVDLP